MNKVNFLCDKLSMSRLTEMLGVLLPYREDNHLANLRQGKDIGSDGISICR